MGRLGRLLVEVKLAGLRILDWETEWRLVDVGEAGTRVREVVVPDGFVPHAGKDHVVVGVTKDDFDVETIAVHRLRGGA